MIDELPDIVGGEKYYTTPPGQFQHRGVARDKNIDLGETSLQRRLLGFVASHENALRAFNIKTFTENYRSRRAESGYCTSVHSGRRGAEREHFRSAQVN